ncbi:MAG: hypothetical protein ACJAVK_000170 [Akkermansiaceae bacterium]|jgi:hypothetical protein
MNRKPLLFTFAFIFATPLADADVLAGWNVDTVNVARDLSPENNHAFESTTTSSNIAGATLSLSSTLTPSDANDSYGFKINVADQQTSLAGAISAKHFIEFNISASPGYQLDLTSLEMNGQSTATGADNIAILTSTNDFVNYSAIASVSGISGNTGGFDTDSSGFGDPIDLTGSSYQGINTITFRIYGWNTNGTTGATSLRNLTGDNLIINGAVVPETSTVLPLAGLLGLTIIGSRRRKA